MDRDPTQTDYDDEVYAEGSYSGSSYAADYPNADRSRGSLNRGPAGRNVSALVADTLNKCAEEDLLCPIASRAFPNSLQRTFVTRL